MIGDALLKPLLARRPAVHVEPEPPAPAPGEALVWRALRADPALAGRVMTGSDGAIVLTGANGGPAPASQKERQRWELHVRLRLAVELGDDAGAAARVRWAPREEGR